MRTMFRGRKRDVELATPWEIKHGMVAPPGWKFVVVDGKVTVEEEPYFWTTYGVSRRHCAKFEKAWERFGVDAEEEAWDDEGDMEYLLRGTKEALDKFAVWATGEPYDREFMHEVKFKTNGRKRR